MLLLIEFNKYMPKMSGSNKKHRPVRKLPNEIRCVLLQGYGSVKQMKAISIPRPTPGDGEVLVHVKSWYLFEKNFLNVPIDFMMC